MVRVHYWENSGQVSSSDVFLQEICQVSTFANVSGFLHYHIRPPPVKYPKKMSEKSLSGFLTLKTEDPASNSGIIALYKV